MSEMKREISIPTDNDGFVLFKCPLCGEYFKLIPEDVSADDVINIWCPSCGLKSDNYLSDEVLELALIIGENILLDNINNEMKKIERQFKGGTSSFKAGHRLKKKTENPLIPYIDQLEIQKYSCCSKQAKIKPIMKFYGSYCPYCGVHYDGN